MASAKEREKAAKRKLNVFLVDALRVGCTRGFRYFEMYMRGREELICFVKNEMLVHPPSSHISSDSQFVLDGSGGFASAHLPIEQQELMISQNTQQKLSGYAFMDIGLPPASPCDHETAEMDGGSTMFLLAGYSRYSCPYVWVRNNHARLVKRSHDGATRFSKDSPLKLKSTSSWQDKDIKVWDILAELVKLCTFPSPQNPFAVDMDYFDCLPLSERVTASGAMVHFLQTVLSHGEDKSYDCLMSEDLQEITKQHYIYMQAYVNQQQESIQ